MTQSRGEAITKNYLINLGVRFQEQKKFKNLKYKGYLRYDFFLNDYNILIEIQGEQHYNSNAFNQTKDQFKQQKTRDKIKKNYCQKNNITLIEIPWLYANVQNKEDLIRELDMKLKPMININKSTNNTDTKKHKNKSINGFHSESNITVNTKKQVGELKAVIKKIRFKKIGFKKIGFKNIWQSIKKMFKALFMICLILGLLVVLSIPFPVVQTISVFIITCIIFFSTYIPLIPIIIIIVILKRRNKKIK